LLRENNDSGHGKDIRTWKLLLPERSIGAEGSQDDSASQFSECDLYENYLQQVKQFLQIPFAHDIGKETLHDGRKVEFPSVHHLFSFSSKVQTIAQGVHDLAIVTVTNEHKYSYNPNHNFHLYPKKFTVCTGKKN
jgi:hypothetical protein